MKKYNIAILWASGAVWIEMINCLDSFKIPIENLKLLWSARSAWTIQKTPFWDIKIEEVNEKSFENIDFALFSAGWDVSAKYAPIAVASWTIVIDNSSYFRYEKDVPLIVPEINANEIKDAKIIANPNCTTAIAAVALWPIYKKFWLKKVIISTYQATSWWWAKAMNELLEETRNYLDWKQVKNEIFAHPIPFNLIPHIDKFQENWYTKEEMKVTRETRKIFRDDSLKISCTAVRIPTLRAHSESITIETEKEVTPEEIKELLKNSPWVKLTDDIKNNIYPMPLNATWKYDVEVWRIRQNLVFWKYWIDLFVSWDQLLKWAALNAVQILNEIIN